MTAVDSGLIDVAREGLSWAALGLLPVVLVCCAAAAILGVLLHRLGLSDSALPLVIRAVAVGFALYFLGDGVVEGTIGLIEETWGTLGDAGAR